jgi:hypothetical protein
MILTEIIPTVFCLAKVGVNDWGKVKGEGKGEGVT